MLHCRVVVVAQPKNCRVPSSALLNYNYDILSTGRAEVINAAPVPANTWQLRLSTKVKFTDGVGVVWYLLQLITIIRCGI